MSEQIDTEPATQPRQGKRCKDIFIYRYNEHDTREDTQAHRIIAHPLNSQKT